MLPSPSIAAVRGPSFPKKCIFKLFLLLPSNFKLETDDSFETTALKVYDLLINHLLRPHLQSCGHYDME